MKKYFPQMLVTLKLSNKTLEKYEKVLSPNVSNFKIISKQT